MGPLLFNVYLDALIENNEILKNLVNNKQLLAFADDMLIETDNQNEAVAALKAFAILEKDGLKLNVSKTQIMTDRKDMQGVKEICCITISDSNKYLGIKIFCDRKKRYNQ